MGAQAALVRAGLPALAAALTLFIASSASAQCAGPSQRFAPLIADESGMDLSAFTLTPRGALGETLSVRDTREYLVQLEAWRRGEALPPRLDLQSGLSLEPDFKPVIEESDLVREQVRDWTLISATGNAFLEALINRSFISRVVGGDDGIPIENLPGAPQRSPPLRVPADPFSGAGTPTIDAQDSVVVIADGPAGLCNGVHIGRGRFLTNLHCALDAGARRILLGNVAWNPNGGKLEGELSCVAHRVWPQSTSTAQIDVAMLEISQSGSLPAEFTTSRFSAAAFRPTPQNVWNPQAPRALIAIQVYPQYAPGTTRMRHRVEDGRWPGSRCQAYLQAPSSTLASNFCSPQTSNPAIQDFGRGHGCDTIPGSSGAPLFVEAGDGKLELVGLHRMGAGPNANEGLDPTNQNWNCAVPSGWFAASIPLN